MEEVKDEPMPSTDEILMEAISDTITTETRETQEVSELEEKPTFSFQEPSGNDGTSGSAAGEIITAELQDVEPEPGMVAEDPPSQDTTEVSTPADKTVDENASEATVAGNEGNASSEIQETTREPEIQILSDSGDVQFIGETSAKPVTTSILQSYILNQNRSNGLPVISNVTSSGQATTRSATAGKNVKVAPKPAPIPIPFTANQIAGGTVVAIPQAKGAPKKIVILPPPSGQSFAPNTVQRCIIRPQAGGIQMPQLIFIPNTTTSAGAPQVQNISTVSAVGGAPLVMTSCLRPNTPQIIRGVTSANQVRPVRATYGTKVRLQSPALAAKAAEGERLCEKCKGPVNNQTKGLSVAKRKDSQTQTPSQTFRTNNTAPLISAMQQRCKKYNQAARAFKAKIKRLEGRIENLQKHVKAGGKPIKTIDNIVKASKPLLSETAHDLFRLLLSSDPEKSSTCTRYADCTKDFALSLYCCSKTAYRVCQSVLKLPTPHGLMRKTRNVTDKAGSSGTSGNKDSSNQNDDGDGEDMDGNEEEDEDEENEDEDDDEDDDGDEDEDMDDGDKNEDAQAASEVVELMHCETQPGFGEGQFEIIIPGNQGRT